MKNINIYGSTGQIGTKSLSIIKNFFPLLKINILVANQNYKKLSEQANIFNPKYVCINDTSKISLLRKKITNKKIEIIEAKVLSKLIKSVKSDISVLAISGYQALNLFPSILSSTKILGLVNKECVVSAGHLFNQLNKKNKTIIYPLDSEHYSLQNLLTNKYNKIKKIYLTASGGPFYNKNFNDIKNISFQRAKKHPKWKMGYKNSIDSATLANKCLEIIEAHYLFNISYHKLNIIIHPESLIHSVIEFENYTSLLNYFYHDMFIPLYNFFAYSNKTDKFPFLNKKYGFEYSQSLNFYKPDFQKYPILKIFNQIDKSKPINIIKFNCANEFAVNLFAQKKISFGEIHKIILDSLTLDIKTNIKDVNNIIEFQKKYYEKLQFNFEK